MSFAIETPEDELLFRAYTQHRDAVRGVVAFGVYPNLVKALEVWAVFDGALADGLSDPDLLAYHAATMQPVAPYIEQLRQLAGSMVQIMVGIEMAAPGTFGIPLPQEPEA